MLWGCGKGNTDSEGKAALYTCVEDAVRVNELPGGAGIQGWQRHPSVPYPLNTRQASASVILLLSLLRMNERSASRPLSLAG